MSGDTLSFTLPDSPRAYIDERAQSDRYSKPSGYPRDLVWRDRQGHANKRVRELISAGLESGPGALHEGQDAAANTARSR